MPSLPTPELERIADERRQAGDRLVAEMNRWLAESFPKLILLQFKARIATPEDPMPDSVIERIYLSNAEGQRIYLPVDVARTTQDIEYNRQDLRSKYKGVMGVEYSPDDHERLLAVGFHLLEIKGPFYFHEVLREDSDDEPADTDVAAD